MSSSESFTIGMACVLELVPACTGPQIRVPLSDHAGERRGRSSNNRTEPGRAAPWPVRPRNWLCARLERRLGRFHLRLGRQVFALGVVHFLLRHQAGSLVGHAFQARVLQVIDVVLRLHAASFMLRVGHHLLLVLDGRGVLLQLGFQLRDFQHRQELVLPARGCRNPPGVAAQSRIPWRKRRSPETGRARRKR